MADSFIYRACKATASVAEGQIEAGGRQELSAR